MFAYSFNKENLEVFEYKDGSMRGVRAKKVFKQKEFVCEYKANVLKTEEEVKAARRNTGMRRTFTYWRYDPLYPQACSKPPKF